MKLKRGYTVRGCFWGEEFGANLNLKGLSIPDYEKTRSAPANDPATDEEALLTLWRLLFLDPLFEFRLMSDRWVENAAGAFGAASLLEERLRGPLETVSRAEKLRALLRALKLETVYTAAAEWLSKESEFEKSVADERAPLVTARALVARMAQLIEADSK